MTGGCSEARPARRNPQGVGAPPGEEGGGGEGASDGREGKGRGLLTELKRVIAVRIQGRAGR